MAVTSSVTFEVQAEDETGDLWIVASKRREKAEAIAEQFRTQGYSNVKISELEEAVHGPGGP